MLPDLQLSSPTRSKAAAQKFCNYRDHESYMLRKREAFLSIIMMIREYKNCGEFIGSERKIQRVPAKSRSWCSDCSFLIKKTWKSLWWENKMMKWVITTDLASSLVKNISTPFLNSELTACNVKFIMLTRCPPSAASVKTCNHI